MQICSYQIGSIVSTCFFNHMITKKSVQMSKKGNVQKIVFKWMKICDFTGINLDKFSVSLPR